jgi:hypothetical protein
VTARGEEFSGELKGNLAVVCHTDYQTDLYALGVAGHERIISACVAGLGKGSGVSFHWPDYEPLKRPKAAPGYYHGHGPPPAGTTALPVPGGYACYRQHLGYDTWHLVAISKHKRLLLDGSDEALWRILRGEQYTTPLLRHWMPELRRALGEAGLLKELTTVGLARPAHLVLVEDPGLDQLVSSGIQTGRLTFTHQETAEKAA